jgi:hypothetical protein
LNFHRARRTLPGQEEEAMTSSSRSSAAARTVRTGIAVLALFCAAGACRKSSPTSGTPSEVAATTATSDAVGTAATDAGSPSPAAEAAAEVADATPATDAVAVSPAAIAEELAKKPCWTGKEWVERPGASAADESAACGHVSYAATDPALELLGGRLTIRPPAGSRLEPRTASIMGAPQAMERESRVFYDVDGEKLVIMAWELLRTGGERFEAGVRKLVEDMGSAEGVTWCVEPVPTAQPGPRALAIVPSAIVGEEEARPVLSVAVDHPDGLVQLLRFYVNPTLAQSGAGCMALARRIAATVGAGPRSVERSGGPRRMNAYGQTQELQIDLPDEFVLTPQEGPDFVVYRIEPIVPLDGATGSIGIYVGDNPESPPGDWAGTVERYKAPLIGQDVEWVTWVVPAADGEPEQHHLEAIADLSGHIGFPRALHVFLLADDAELLLTLKDVIKTLKVVDLENR